MLKFLDLCAHDNNYNDTADYFTQLLMHNVSKIGAKNETTNSYFGLIRPCQSVQYPNRKPKAPSGLNKLGVLK